MSCTSIKGLIGHAEAAAGGFGEVSILVSAVGLAMIGPNAQLQNLNSHLYSHAANHFEMPTELVHKCCLFTLDLYSHAADDFSMPT